MVNKVKNKNSVFQAERSVAADRIQATPIRVPANCDEVEENGNQGSGIYWVKNSNQLKAVFCDFTKMKNETGKLEFFSMWLSRQDQKLTIDFFVRLRESLRKSGCINDLCPLSDDESEGCQIWPDDCLGICADERWFGYGPFNWHLYGASQWCLPFRFVDHESQGNLRHFHLP